MKDIIIDMMHSVAEMTGCELVADLNEETLLLESGLDSLGFAILVSRLEEELDYDPFSVMDQPVYPRTLAELVGIYQKYAPAP